MIVMSRKKFNYEKFLFMLRMRLPPEYKEVASPIVLSMKINRYVEFLLMMPIRTSL